MNRRWSVVLALVLLAGVVSSGEAAPPSTTVLTAADAQLGDAFGRRVSISGDTILVGANGDDERGTDAGAAYVFERDATGTWMQRQKLLPPQVLAGDFFGWSVSIKGDALVVGAPGDDRDNNGAPNAATANRGAAYVYRRAHGTWTLETRLQPSELAIGDAFGWNVAIEVPLLLVSAVYRDTWVGAWNANDDIGVVFSFVASPSGWLADGTLPEQNRQASGQFGFSMASTPAWRLSGRRRASSQPATPSGLHGLAMGGCGSSGRPLTLPSRGWRRGGGHVPPIARHRFLVRRLRRRAGWRVHPCAAASDVWMVESRHCSPWRA